jgi:hypothetical protein
MKQGSQLLQNSEWAEREVRQFHRMLALGFVLLLIPATIGRLSGWKWWRPEAPGKHGKRSILGEAWGAAEEAISLTFPACYVQASPPRQSTTGHDVGLGASPKTIPPRGVSR